ncbi:hypothetical protein EZS27_008914 [termite gut metagenome]|uniref:Uncharacterized protein n=1 Tax=termite gut metagenome TaxID=433724 RepID=A0A5J4SB59_9ZZZZ
MRTSKELYLSESFGFCFIQLKQAHTNKQFFTFNSQLSIHWGVSRRVGIAGYCHYFPLNIFAPFRDLNDFVATIEKKNNALTIVATKSYI